MRYLPGLIPEQFSVLKNYFKGSIYRPRKSSGPLRALGWIFGIFFLIGAFAELPHPPLALFYGLLGILLLPPGHNRIEKIFRFRLRTKAKTILVVVLLIGAAPMMIHYGDIDRKAYAEEQQKATQEEKEKAVATAAAVALEQQQKESARQDSLNAINKVTTLIASGKYETAIPELDAQIAHNPGNADLFYERAICYSKTGHIQDAVKDCKAASDLGKKEAEQLNDKINPVVKHITGYVTQCCDGSTSYATGRGACSHHGGVCSWNAPVYEESRKYE